MAKISAKGAAISVDDSGGSARVISGDVMSYTIDYTVGTVDITGFGEPQNFTPDVTINKVTLTVKWNTAATTGAMTVLRGLVAAYQAGGATSSTVSITPEASGIAFSGEFMCVGIHPAGQAQGSAIELGTVDFMPMGTTAGSWA